ncbi:MAG: hypothetical protein ACT4P2_10370 [Pseudomonadota bacterium]
MMVSVVAVAIAAAPAWAQQREQPRLADSPPDQQVASIRYCEGTYVVATKDGAKIPFPEFNLRFKTDSGAYGPRAGVPALLPAAMMGDRAFIVFSKPEEISGFIKTQC